MDLTGILIKILSRSHFWTKGPVSQEGETPGSRTQTVNINQAQFPADDDKDNSESAMSTNNFDLKNLPDNFVGGGKFLHVCLIEKTLL